MRALRSVLAKLSIWVLFVPADGISAASMNSGDFGTSPLFCRPSNVDTQSTYHLASWRLKNNRHCFRDHYYCRS